MKPDTPEFRRLGRLIARRPATRVGSSTGAAGGLGDPPAGASTGTGGAPTEQSTERCDLCAEPIPDEHRHLLELATRQLMCACTACRLLFERPAAGEDKYRLVPDDRRYITDFLLDDAAWAMLGIPVTMAFFFRNSAARRTVAYYPSPGGATESLLQLDSWQPIVDANPLLGEMADDVEALLVRRDRVAGDHWLAPIDDCYALVGTLRTHWKGLSGGDDVWREIDQFFAGLHARAVNVHRDGTPQRDRQEAGVPAGHEQP